MDEWLATANAACPVCNHKHFTMRFDSTLQFLPHGATKVKQRDPHESSKRKLRREHFKGLEPNVHGTLVLKERLIDKDADYYFELVVDPASGQILRKIEEPLRKHVGRGTAKKRKSK